MSHSDGRVGRWLIGLAALWLGAAPVSAETRERFSEPNKLRVLILSGRNNHDWRVSTPFLRRVLEHTGRFDVRVTEEPTGITASTILPYDVLVLYDMTRDLGEEERRNLRDFVESGKGLVVLHHAIANYGPEWEWWWREVVGGRYILEEGHPRPSSYHHDVELYVRSVASHPITRDLGPMRLVDETYKDLWISPEVKVLLEVDEETADGPVTWISPYERSRVVYIQLGHDRRAHRHPGYRELVRRAILWSANRLD